MRENTLSAPLMGATISSISAGISTDSGAPFMAGFMDERDSLLMSDVIFAAVSVTVLMADS